MRILLLCLLLTMGCDSLSVPDTIDGVWQGPAGTNVWTLQIQEEIGQVTGSALACIGECPAGLERSHTLTGSYSHPIINLTLEPVEGFTLTRINARINDSGTQLDGTATLDDNSSFLEVNLSR